MNNEQVLITAGAIGGAAQWLRASVKFSDGWYAVLICGAAIGYSWMMGMDITSLWAPDRADAWLHVSAVLLAMLGGTQGISTASNVAVAIRPSLKANLLVPVTNSKGGTTP